MDGQADPRLLEHTRELEHPGCWVCGSTNDAGLRVDFRPGPDGAIIGEFSCAERFSGYEGFIHGGVVSSLLDGAMTNCLMARGLASVTADLLIRFRKPVLVGIPATVTARVLQARLGMHTVEATLEQDGEVRAEGSGRFLAHPREH
jgi:uncharacterized protein (TIGR00369 family)